MYKLLIRDRSLWVLQVAKDSFGFDSLNSEEIASILTRALEISTKPSSVSASFARSQDMIYSEYKNGKAYYSIMRAGKDHLLSIGRPKEGILAYLVEPGQTYSGKRMLVDEVFSRFKGEIRISDPYVGKRLLI